MGKIFVGQNALRFQANVDVDITGALTLEIRYKKPDASTSAFTATVLDAEAGTMYYDVALTSELDQAGTWLMWGYIKFSDGREAVGIPVRVVVHAIGEII